jgi:hypothetical protein
MNFGSTPLGGTMSKREPQIILKAASEAMSKREPQIILKDEFR